MLRNSKAELKKSVAYKKTCEWKLLIIQKADKISVKPWMFEHSFVGSIFTFVIIWSTGNISYFEPQEDH